MAKTGPYEIGNEINDILNGTHPASGTASGGSAPQLFMGMTLSGLCLALLFALIGMGYVVYAKKQKRLVIGAAGMGLMLFTYFVTNTWLILLIGLLLTFLPSILKRYDMNV